MDNKKRKFNFLDAVIILAVLAVIAFAAYKLVPHGSEASTVGATITFYSAEIPDYVVDQIYEGAPSKDFDRSLYLGQVESFEVGDSLIWDTDSNGNQVSSPKSDAKTVIMKVHSTVEASPYGVLISDVNYAVGHTMVVCAGFAKMSMVVSDIEYDDPSIPQTLAKGITG